MAQVVPLTDDARQTFRTSLGAQSVRLTLWWQPFDRAWYLSASFLDGTNIINGVRLVEKGRPLDDVLTTFEGAFFIEGIGEPGRNAWTATHNLIYLTAAERADLPVTEDIRQSFDKPSSFTGEPGNGQVTLMFSAGESLGSSFLAWQYRFRILPGNFLGWVDMTGATLATESWTVMNLQNLALYEFEVRLLSEKDWSQRSDPLRLMPMPASA